MISLYNSLIKESSGQEKYIFVVIKPGFLDKSGEILQIYKENGWEIELTTIKQLQPKEAHDLYAIHKKESFYKDLCKYMCSGLTRAMIFKKHTNKDIFKEATKLKDIIREKWGESDMRNVVHSSDSEEHMEQEARIYFNIIKKPA